MQKGKSYYDGDYKGNKILYDENELKTREEPDPVIGVSPYHYADIEPDLQRHDFNFEHSSEFAVVSFWALDEDEKFTCNRFFIIPKPLKREIMNSEGTRLN